MITYDMFNDFFRNLHFSNVYVGFSGGSDSTALLVLTKYYADKYKFAIKAINFEHGIRGEESKQDTEFCKDFCKKHNIDFETYSLGLSATTKNVECIARQKRLQKYREIISDKNDTVVLLGHHLDDKIENFFIRLARGSNISGLCGLKSFNKIEGITFGRPFLSVKKTELEQFLKDSNYSWRIDKSNFNNKYTRNYIRNVLLPEWYKNEGLIEGGIKLAIKNIEEDSSFIDDVVHTEYKKIAGMQYLKIDFLKKYHIAIRNRLIKQWIVDKKGNFIISKNFLDQFNTAISESKSYHRSICLKDGDRLVLTSDGKIFFKKSVGLV